MLKKLLLVPVVLAFAGLMAYSTSWWVRGRVAAWRWDRKSTLQCFGSTQIRLEGIEISLPKGAAPSEQWPSISSSCDEERGCPLIDAAGNCELEIVNCKLAAPTVLNAGGNAHVKVSGSTLDGRIERGGNAEVTGLPELDAQTAKERLSKKFGAGACNGVVECYKKADELGNIAGRLTVEIGADGRATDARYKGSAGKAVVDCLVGLGRARRIAGFDGQPGTLTCDWAGSLTPGSQMMNMSFSFTR